MEVSTRFVGMDVHKDTIVVAITATGEVGKATAYGTFPNTAAALETLVKRLRQAGSGLAGCEFQAPQKGLRLINV
jgi:transposase